MSKRSGWWIAFVGLAVVALVVAAAVASALLPPRQTGDIAAPPVTPPRSRS
ncbi:hypothetical protein [Actinotalea sp.]|uniref:hypothetical protein n=1 Tax=Actinotalea sp. TaxID=1872145 RepID=UPI00356324EA